MKVKDVMVRNIVSVGTDDTVAHALAKIKKNNIHQVPIIENGKYFGMLTLKNIVTKNINPSEAKCAHFAINTPSLRSEDDISTAVQLLLNSGMRALPVIDVETVGILSETDIMKIVEGRKDLLRTPLEGIAVECETLARKDTIGKVKNIMIDKNVSRVPLVEGSKIIGVVGATDMIKLLEGKEQMPARGGKTRELGTVEKLKIDDAPAESFMHNATTLASGALLGDAINALKKNDEVILLGDSIKIVTPKDVLEFAVGSKEETLHVDIIGMHDESAQFKIRVDKLVGDFARKMTKTVERAQYLFIHVEKGNKGGAGDRRFLYLVRARFGTPKGMFVAKASDWEPMNAVQDVIDKLEREVLRKYGRTRDTKMKKKILTKRR